MSARKEAEAVLRLVAGSIISFGIFVGSSLPLNKVHEEWGRWLMSSNDRKTIRQLLAHRESYKSSVLALLVARHIFFNPDDQIAIVRASKTEAQNFISTIDTILHSENVIKMLQYFKFIKGGSVWTDDNRDRKVLSYRRKSWKEGTLDAIGTMQKITGRHYDLLICDDFVNIDDRLSPSLRVKKYLYLSEYVLNILTGKGLAINSGTFWHEEDANQELKRKYQDDENVVFEEKVYPLGSVFGESKEDIASKKASLIKRLGKSLYYANYELTGYRDEACGFAEIKYRGFRYEGGVIYGAIDPAYEGSNRTAVSIGTKVGGEYYVIGKVYEEPIYELYGVIAKLLQDHYTVKCFYENNADKGLGAKELQKVSSVEIVPYANTLNKVLRITATLYPRRELMYFDEVRSDRDYLSEVMSWNEYATRDDAIDSLEKVVRELDGVESERVASPHQWGDLNHGYKRHF